MEQELNRTIFAYMHSTDDLARRLAMFEDFGTVLDAMVDGKIDPSDSDKMLKAIDALKRTLVNTK